MIEDDENIMGLQLTPISILESLTKPKRKIQPRATTPLLEPNMRMNQDSSYSPMEAEESKADNLVYSREASINRTTKTVQVESKNV